MQKYYFIISRCKSNTKGTAASYIPQLAKAMQLFIDVKLFTNWSLQYSNDLWGLSVCTVDGQRLSLGNVDTAFTLQSCSKPFTYGVCLQHLGHEHVHRYIGGDNQHNSPYRISIDINCISGYEPSGKNFNEICLDRKSK